MGEKPGASKTKLADLKRKKPWVDPAALSYDGDE